MSVTEGAEKRPIPQTFGILLKRLRLVADLTQEEELAERAGVSARLISDLERGAIHRPRRDTVHLLADGLRLQGPERDDFVAQARGRTPPHSSGPPANSTPQSLLPQAPTPIVGRLSETAAAVALLLDSDMRTAHLDWPRRRWQDATGTGSRLQSA